VNNPVVTHDESLYSRFTELGRCRRQRESANHHTFHYKIHLPQRCRRSLSFQNFKKISVVWLRLTGVTLLQCAGNLFADRPPPAPVRVLPGQPVLLSRRAYNTLRVLVHIVSFPFLECILMLRFNIPMADINRVQFVAAYATIVEFLPSSFGIEVPF